MGRAARVLLELDSRSAEEALIRLAAGAKSFAANLRLVDTAAQDPVDELAKLRSQAESIFGVAIAQAERFGQALKGAADGAGRAAGGQQKLSKEVAATNAAMKIQQQASLGALSGVDKLNESYKRQIAKLQELKAAGADANTVMAAQKALDDKLAADKGRLEKSAEFSKLKTSAAQATEALGKLSPQLASSVRGVAGLTAVVDVLSSGLSGPLLLAMAAVSAGTFAWRQEQERLERQLAGTRAAQDIVRDSALNIKDAYLELKVLTGELTAEEAALERQRQTSFANNLPRIKEITASIAEQSALVAGLKAEQNGAGIVGGAQSPTFKKYLAEQEQALQKLFEQRDAANKAIRDEVDARASVLAQQQANREEQEAETAAKTTATAARKAETEAIRDQAQAARELSAMLADMGDGMFSPKRKPGGGEQGKTFRQQIEALAPPMSETDKLKDLQAQANELFASGALSAQEYADAMDLIAKRLREVTAEQQRSTAEQQRAALARAQEIHWAGRGNALSLRQQNRAGLAAMMAGDGSGAGAFLTSLVGGAGGLVSRAGAGGAGAGLMTAGAGLASLAGPLGLAASIGMSTLNATDEHGRKLSPAEAIRQQTEAFKEALLAGLDALPEILTEVVPDFVGSLVTELPPAIAKALYGIPVKLLKNLLTDDEGKPGWLAQKVNALAYAASGQRFHSGGLTRNEGFILAQEGEQYTRRGDMMSQSAATHALPSGSSSAPVIHIHGSPLPGALDNLVQRQNTRWGTSGWDPAPAVLGGSPL